MWIPAHVGIEGNEIADSLAKESLELIDAIEYPLFLVDGMKIMKSDMNDDWQKSYADEMKGEKFKTMNPTILEHPWYHESDLKAKDIKLINRLISNHSYDKRWLFRFGKIDDENCSGGCKEIETAEHLIFNCRLYNNSRRRYPYLSAIKSTEELWKSKSRSEALKEIVNFLKECKIDF